MKKYIKLITMILCLSFLLPIVVNASIGGGEYEITFGAKKGSVCSTGSYSDPFSLSAKTCDSSASSTKLGEYSYSKKTFTFVEDKSIYLFGHDGNSINTIIINGKNTLDYIKEEYYDYKISGDGTLTIKGVYNNKEATDSDGNRLYQIIYKNDGKYTELVDKNGDKVLVKSSSEIEGIFDTLKANNSCITTDSYDASNFMISSYYVSVYESITKAWVEEHIVTDLPITYNLDKTVTFGKVTTDSSNTTDKDNSSSSSKNENNNTTTDNSNKNNSTTDTNKNNNSNDTTNTTNDLESVMDEKVYSLADGEIVFTSKTELDRTYKLKTTNLMIGITSEKINSIQGGKYNLLSLYDISVIDSKGNVVTMENGTFTVKLPLTNEMKQDNVVVAYVKDGVVKEILTSKIEENYIAFNTDHLSEYAVLVTEKEESNLNITINDDNTTSNDSDSIIIGVVISIIIVVVLGTIIYFMINKKKWKKSKK